MTGTMQYVTRNNRLTVPSLLSTALEIYPVELRQTVAHKLLQRAVWSFLVLPFSYPPHSISLSSRNSFVMQTSVCLFHKCRRWTRNRTACVLCTGARLIRLRILHHQACVFKKNIRVPPVRMKRANQTEQRREYPCKVLPLRSKNERLCSLFNSQ